MALRFGLTALAAVADGMRTRSEASRCMGVYIVIRCGEECWNKKSVGVDVGSIDGRSCDVLSLCHGEARSMWQNGILNVDVSISAIKLKHVRLIR